MRQLLTNSGCFKNDGPSRIIHSKSASIQKSFTIVLHKQKLPKVDTTRQSDYIPSMIETVKPLQGNKFGSRQCVCPQQSPAPNTLQVRH